MAGKLKTWIWIVAGIVIIGIICVVAMAGAGFYFFSRHFDTQVVSRESAGEQFDDVKARFAKQQPLIELDEHGRFLRANVDRPANPNTKIPDQLFVLAFDPHDRRIVRVTLPFWLLRMKPRGTIDFNASRVDLEDLKLTVEDLERFGPTLIVDHQGMSGERVLVWSQ
jgi:hypothetical protein